MGHHAKKPQEPRQSTKEILKQRKKESKQKLKEKRARLVVHNLPFQATEENVKEHFGKFGQVKNVEILKKSDGKLVGCCFIQFEAVQKAAKARSHTNGKPFLGRDISVDFALAKGKYQKVKQQQQQEIKTEDNVEVKEEPLDDVKTEDKETTEEDSKDLVIDLEKQEKSSDEEGEDSESDEDEEEEPEEEEVKPKVQSNDVTEGKTVFVKNVPFSATNEDLKQCMKQFGPVYYALICMDKNTEHSKGSAFVKFVEKEDAEKALSAGTELTLLGNVLDCHPALGRNEINHRANLKKEEQNAPKDSRNLFLVREGVILAGTKAAEGVSAGDMAKRLQLEQYKTQILRNLNMFISRERLIIHNLPISWTDDKLRALFTKFSPPNAVIKETKIMRNLKNVDEKGVGISKEYGFVSFARHEDALAALRNLNNNPNIFQGGRRPIVAFSIENRSMINAKQKRMEKSRQKNPKSRQYDPTLATKDEKQTKPNAQGSKINKNKTRVNQTVGTNTRTNDFTGVNAKPGIQKMRSRFNLKTQAQIHHQQLKKEKKNRKAAKSLQEKKSELAKQDKQKINHNKKRKSDDNFSTMVNNYKQLMGASLAKKTKWYEEG